MPTSWQERGRSASVQVCGRETPPETSLRTYRVHTAASGSQIRMSTRLLAARAAGPPQTQRAQTVPRISKVLHTARPLCTSTCTPGRARTAGARARTHMRPHKMCTRAPAGSTILDSLFRVQDLAMTIATSTSSPSSSNQSRRLSGKPPAASCAYRGLAALCLLMAHTSLRRASLVVHARLRLKTEMRWHRLTSNEP